MWAVSVRRSPLIQHSTYCTFSATQHWRISIWMPAIAGYIIIVTSQNRNFLSDAISFGSFLPYIFFSFFLQDFGAHFPIVDIVFQLPLLFIFCFLMMWIEEWKNQYRTYFARDAQRNSTTKAHISKTKSIYHLESWSIVSVRMYQCDVWNLPTPNCRPSNELISIYAVNIRWLPLTIHFAYFRRRHACVKATSSLFFFPSSVPS